MNDERRNVFGGMDGRIEGCMDGWVGGMMEGRKDG